MAAKPASVSLVQVTVHFDSTHGVRRFEIYADEGFKRDGSEKAIGTDSINYSRSGTSGREELQLLKQILEKIAAQYSRDDTITISAEGPKLLPD